MKKLTSGLSRAFIRVMLLLFMFGAGLWVLSKIIEFSGKSGVTAPVGAVASRYRQFATTGS